MRSVLYGALVAAVVLVVYFVWAHGKDLRRDQELKDLRAQVSRDSLARVAQVAITDSLRQQVKVQVDTVQQVTTQYNTVVRAVHDTVERILNSAQPDTVKVRELVHVIDTLQVAGAREVKACTELAQTCSQLRVQVDSERKAWGGERQDLQRALTLAERLHRHWGLGATCGYGAIKVGPGVQVGPGCLLGLTYRW
jgi:hypothetical protein